MADNFSVDLYDNQTAVLGAAIALEHRLYVPGWTLRRLLESIETDHRDGRYERYIVAIGSANNQPVCVVTTGRFNNTIQAFCRAEYRRLGYASRVVETILAYRAHLSLPIPTAKVGIPGSYQFWGQFGIAAVCY